MSLSAPPGSARFSAAMILPAALLSGLLLWVLMLLHGARAERARLRQELSDGRVLQRSAATWEGRTADAMERVKRLEAALEAMPQSQPKVESPDTARAAELERVVGFLREEIKAAQETIGRLKEQSLTPAAKPSRSKR